MILNLNLSNAKLQDINVAVSARSKHCEKVIGSMFFLKIHLVVATIGNEKMKVYFHRP